MNDIYGLMKRFTNFLVYFLALVLLPCQLVAQIEYAYPVTLKTCETYRLKGKVKQISANHYGKPNRHDMNANNTVASNDSIPFKYSYLYRFDSNGNLLHFVHHNADGVVIDSTCVQIFEQGRLSVYRVLWYEYRIYYNSNGKIERIEEMSHYEPKFVKGTYYFSYSEGRLTKREYSLNLENYPADMLRNNYDRNEKTTYHYDKLGRLISEIHYSIYDRFKKDRIIHLANKDHEISYLYNADGLLILSKQIDARRRNPGSEEIKYLYSGNELTEMHTTDFNGKSIKKKTVEKFENGLIVSRITTRYPELLIFTTEYKYVFDELGNWLEEEVFKNGQLSEKTTRIIEYFD